jgi:hypothetical protein
MITVHKEREAKQAATAEDEYVASEEEGTPKSRKKVLATSCLNPRDGCLKFFFFCLSLAGGSFTHVERVHVELLTP